MPMKLNFYLMAIQEADGIRPKIKYQLVKVVQYKESLFCVVVNDNGKLVTLSVDYFKQSEQDDDCL